MDFPCPAWKSTHCPWCTGLVQEGAHYGTAPSEGAASEPMQASKPRLIVSEVADATPGGSRAHMPGGQIHIPNGQLWNG